MTGQNSAPSKPKQARIEIIPLIDVIFFLLATFILFTLSLEKIQSLPVELPKASTAPPSAQDDDTVTIQVSESGTCYWTYRKSTEAVDIREIKPRLQNYVSNTADPRVLVTTDDRAKFSIAIRVLDEVRLAKIQKVSVETRVRPTGR
jgi:biopolymer transport protein ExbD